MGGDGGLRHAAAEAGRQPDRGAARLLRRVPVRPAGDRTGGHPRLHRPVHGPGQPGQRGRGPAGLPLRPARADPLAGHGLLVHAGRGAPGRAGAARRRVRLRAGRGRLPVAAPVPLCLLLRHLAARRPVQDVRRERRRVPGRRGRWHGDAGPAVRRGAGRAPDPGGHPRLGGQPGRPQQRPDRAEPERPGGRDPAGAGRGASLARRGDLPGGARIGHQPR